MDEVDINSTIELPELTQDWEIGCWRAQQNLVPQDPGAVAPQETDADLPVRAQGSLEEARVGGGPCRVGGTECDLLKEVAIIFVTYNIQ